MKSLSTKKILYAAADGLRAVSASSDNTLKIWDLRNGKELRTLTGHSGPVVDVAVFADGRRAISASSDGTLKLWDLENGVELHTLTRHLDSVRGVALSTDGLRAVSASSDNTLKIWDLRTRRCVAAFTCDATVMCCAFAGRTVVAGDAGGRVHFLLLELSEGTSHYAVESPERHLCCVITAHAMHATPRRG